ncbi:MAG: sensor histidine kinase [Janthinobacterium lividum]
MKISIWSRNGCAALACLFVIALSVVAYSMIAPGVAHAGSAIAPAAQAPLLLDENTDSAQGAVAVLRDDSRTLTIHDVSAAALQTRFVPLDRGLSAGYTDAPYWLRVTAARGLNAPGRWLLEVRPAWLDHVDLYEPDPQGGYTVTHNGSLVPFYARRVSYRAPVFIVDFPDSTPRVFYLRVRTRYTLMASLTWWQPRPFIAAKLTEQAISGAFYGGCLLAFSVGLVFWLVVGDGLFIWYLIYLGSTTVKMFTSNGYSAEYLFPSQPVIANALLPIAFCTSIASAAWLLPSLFNLREHSPRVDSLIKSGGLLTILLIPLALIDYGLVAPVLDCLSALVLGVTLVAGAQLPKSKMPLARHYAAVLALPAVGLLLMPLRNLGLLGGDMEELYGYIWQLSALVFLMVLVAGIAERMKRSEDATHDARAQLVQSSRRVEAELSERVQQRTEQLNMANEALTLEIAERRRAQAAMRRAHDKAQAALAAERRALEQQRQFISMISHEFRTPLAIIDATTQNLLLTSEAELGHHADVRDENVAAINQSSPRYRKILRAAGRLRMLIDNYLTGDRLATAEIAPNMHEFDPALVLEKVIETAHDRHPKVNSTLTALPMFTGDAGLFEIACANLVDNAVKYCPPDALIDIVAYVDRDDLVVSVHDHGPGIAASELQRIFEKYQRGVNPPGIAGAGLGLFLVERIVTLHGGRVLVDSTPGAGSTFSMRLPLSHGDANEVRDAGSAMMLAPFE